MAHNVKFHESGRPYYFYVGFDLSGFSRLQLFWTKPDGTTMIRDSSASAIRISASAVFVTALSATLSSNEYAVYTIGQGSAQEIDQTGAWKVNLIYWDSATTPVTRLVSDKNDTAGNPVIMQVDPGIEVSAASA